MKKIKVAIMGLGTVGGGTYEVLTRNRDVIASGYGVDAEVVKVLDRSEDVLVSRGVPAEKFAGNIDEIIKDDDISVVVETMGGLEPAGTFIIKALKSGKSVVTANKELLAKRFDELEEAAKEGGAGLYFEASCVGGVPVIRTLTDSMQANRITEIMGIINGTTNYILTKMSEDGLTYAAALKEAQKLGYAEFDPTADVEGFDAAYKLSILASLAFHTRIPLSGIYREGISKVTPKDIAVGRSMGYTLKLLAIGRKNADGSAEARVHPAFVPESHPLSSVRGAFNAVFLKGDFVDEIMLYGRGAGAHPTASAIVSDIIYCADREEPLRLDFKNGEASLADDFSSEYYLSLTVADKPGILASITKVFGDCGISIGKMQQQVSAAGQAEIIILTHTTKESAVRTATERLESLGGVKKLNTTLRVIK
ncbi:MAG: homoserine dehydrogenase [Clostridia bacterium]|jgi:homoserine dehydrogenase|nr:homoserine dehydrogenase [Clostridia bacterium]